MIAKLPDLPDPCTMPLYREVAEIIKRHAKHGDVILIEWLERNLREKHRSSKFNYLIMRTKRLLQEAGLRLSAAGQKGQSYRILGKMETVDFAMQKEQLRAEQTRANAEMLGRIDAAGLPAEDQAKLAHWQTKTTALFINQSSILAMKDLPPSPAMEALAALRAPEALKAAQELSLRNTTLLHVAKPDKA